MKIVVASVYNKQVIVINIKCTYRMNVAVLVEILLKPVSVPLTQKKCGKVINATVSANIDLHVRLAPFLMKTRVNVKSKNHHQYSLLLDLMTSAPSESVTRHMISN